MQQRGRVGLREVSSCARLERIDIVAHPSIQPPSRLSMAPVLASVVVVARCASRSVVRAIAVHRREVEARLRSWRRGRVAMGHWRRREIVRDHLVQSVRSSTQVRDRERVTTSNNPSCMLHAYIWMQVSCNPEPKTPTPGWTLPSSRGLSVDLLVVVRQCPDDQPHESPPPVICIPKNTSVQQ